MERMEHIRFITMDHSALLGFSHFRLRQRRCRQPRSDQVQDVVMAVTRTFEFIQ